MRAINKKLTMIILGIIACFSTCKQPFDADPVPATSASSYSTKFLFVNTSFGAPSLDLHVNNLVTGASAATDTTSNQSAYTTVKITYNAALSNTNINATATSGTIGGVLGSNNLLFRSTNNGVGNFTALDLAGYTGTGTYAGYTIFAVDSINRPIPVRTLNSGNFGDVTYYSTKSSFTAKSVVDGVTDTTIQLNMASNNSVTIANLCKKYNGNSLPSFLVPIGVVPLGSSDPGGVRFYLTQDVFPVYSATDLTTKAGFRFVDTSPTAAASVTKTTYTASLYVRLFGAPNLTISSGSTYVMHNANLNPSVGSRTVTAAAPNFTLQTLSASGSYTIQVSTSATYATIAASQTYTFVTGKNYTIYTKGLVNGTGNSRLRIGVIQHN
jgi:hypothetical protein